jgi:hypothetical protein
MSFRPLLGPLETFQEIPTRALVVWRRVVRRVVWRREVFIVVLFGWSFGVDRMVCFCRFFFSMDVFNVLAFSLNDCLATWVFFYFLDGMWIQPLAAQVFVPGLKGYTRMDFRTYFF